MFEAFNIAISGMNAQTQALDVAANNIANINTNGYKSQRAEFEENDPAGGVVVTLSRENNQGPFRLDHNGKQVEMSNTSLEREMVNLDVAKIGYSANLNAFQTQNELVGTLLNLFA